MTIWFKAHVLLAIIILVADAKGTLEPTVKAWEKKLGIPVPEEVKDEKEEIKEDR